MTSAHSQSSALAASQLPAEIPSSVAPASAQIPSPALPALAQTLPPAPALRSPAPAAVSLLRVYGEDAFSYLQSQVSADLRASGERWVRYALWLDARGHVLADSFILREGAESFLLFSYGTPADRLEEIVLSNVIADDVEVEHLGGHYRHWALYADTVATSASSSGAAAAIAGAGETASAGDGEIAAALSAGSESRDVTAIAGEGNSAAPPSAGETPSAETGGILPPSLQPESGRFVVVAADDSADTVSQPSQVLLFAGRNTAGENYDLLLPEGMPLPPFAAVLPEAGWAAREALRIAGGIPAVPQDIGAGDLPQEGGDLPRVAVSTSKGCYLGQEVIARWHATGQVRSGLFRVQLLAGQQLNSGSQSPMLSQQTTLSEQGSGGADSAAERHSVSGQHSAADGYSTGCQPSQPAQSPQAAEGLALRSVQYGSLPLRLYAGAKPVGELRSFASENGAGLALLRIHRLGDARQLSLEAGGAAVFEVLEPVLS